MPLDLISLFGVSSALFGALAASDNKDTSGAIVFNDQSNGDRFMYLPNEGLLRVIQMDGIVFNNVTNMLYYAVTEQTAMEIINNLAEAGHLNVEGIMPLEGTSNQWGEFISILGGILPGQPEINTGNSGAFGWPSGNSQEAEAPKPSSPSAFSELLMNPMSWVVIALLWMVNKKVTSKTKRR